MYLDIDTFIEQLCFFFFNLTSLEQFLYKLILAIQNLLLGFSMLDSFCYLRK